jgi:hypothetical protein
LALLLPLPLLPSLAPAASAGQRRLPLLLTSAVLLAYHEQPSLPLLLLLLLLPLLGG